MPILPGRRLGPYEILTAIGAGGMGEVYKARDTRLNRIVAIKVLPDHFADRSTLRERFEREAKTIASLNHPHICTLYDIGHQDAIDYLVMEYIEGETLAQRLTKGPLPLQQVLQYAIEIVDALDKAHRKGITHRDLKPGNIMLTKSGTKLLDFGLAKLTEGDKPATPFTELPTQKEAITAEGTILGTLQYMAPEQVEGREADARTDIFAFGLVVYEMATGEKAFEGKSQASLIAKILETEPAPISSLQPMTPPTLDRLVKKCMAKEPERRWQAASDVCDELGWVAEERETPANVSGEQLPFVWMALTGVLLVALAALAFVHFRETSPPVRTVRFQVPGPADGTVTFFQLSPDGQYLAFVAQKEGHTQLWVQPLSSTEPQALPGTDDVSYPFWSPDSADIAYFAEGKLKKIAATGGIPQVLCDAPAGRGGSWSEDGVILFTPNLSGPLYRISSAGGIPTAVTDATGTEPSDRYPFFLPGGHTFLYYRVRNSREQNGIYAGSLDGLKPVRILPDDSYAVYVPGTSGGGGYLLFRRKEALMAQGFDRRSLKLSGEMSPVAEKVAEIGNVGYGSFTASANGELAYVPGHLFQLVWMDRTGKQLGAASKPASEEEGQLSPDEKQIVLAVGPDLKTGDLWLEDVSRGVLSRFTFGPDASFSGRPVWSPDSSRIVYMGYANNVFNIYQKSINGAGAPERLKTGGNNVFPSDWSPDGKFILYSEFDEKTNDDLWFLPVTGDHKPVPYLQTRFNEDDGHFSPDGHWVAYTSDESGHTEVYVQPFPATGSKWQISTAGATYPRWSRDGRELFYISMDQKLTAVSVKPGVGSGPSLEAGAPQPLFGIPSIAFPDQVYQPTKDGRRFLVDVPAGGGAGVTTPVTMILNWTAGLKK